MATDELDRPLSHAELREVVAMAEPLLREIWARRTNDRDWIVLADLGRPECLDWLKGQWGKQRVNTFIRTATMERRLAFVAYLQPARVIDELLSGSCGWAQREAGKELRGFANGWPLMVPLWVVTREGHWATCWAPPGSNALVVRYTPEPTPEMN